MGKVAVGDAREEVILVMGKEAVRDVGQEGRTDGRSDKRTHGQSDRQTNGQSDRRKDGKSCLKCWSLADLSIVCCLFAHKSLTCRLSVCYLFVICSYPTARNRKRCQSELP